MDVLYETQRFQSFQEFETARRQYEEDKNMVFVTGHSSSIRNENKKLIAAGASATELYKEELKHKNVKFCCKFGGPSRIQTGKGQREVQSSFKINCPVLIHLIAEKNCLVVKKFITEHENHNCTPEEVNIIPERRKVHDDDKGTVDVLLTAKVRPFTIRFILRGTHSGKLTARDIANFRAKRKRELLNERTEAEMLTDTLCKLWDEDPCVFLHISKDVADSLEVLFIQTTRMRLNVQKYGLVLLFDHTYKINKNRLPVSVFKVMDGNGLGRCAGIAYVVNEEKVTLATVVSAFKESIGEEIASSIRTVTKDKDFSEAGAVKEVLPQTQIQLCDYHVSNTFQARSSKEDSQVRSLIFDMRYCESDEVFQLLSAKLEAVASKTFWDYFSKNWIHCPRGCIMASYTPKVVRQGSAPQPCTKESVCCGPEPRPPLGPSAAGRRTGRPSNEPSASRGLLGVQRHEQREEMLGFKVPEPGSVVVPSLSSQVGSGAGRAALQVSRDTAHNEPLLSEEVVSSTVVSRLRAATPEPSHWQHIGEWPPKKQPGTIISSSKPHKPIVGFIDG